MSEKCSECGSELVGICYPCICPECDAEAYEEYLVDMDDIIGDY